MWFKTHTVQDTDNHFSETNVLYRFAVDEEGVPIVITEAYIVDKEYWYSETTSFSTTKSALSFIHTCGSVHAVDWLDRIIESDGLPD
jgi:hypothetical protein